jgi:hypothetical protein
MKRLRGCLTVVFIFGCGFLVGGFLGAIFGWTALFNKIVKSGPMAVQEVIIDRVRNDLQLKGESRGEARKIVQETALELEAATKDLRPKVGEILGRAEDRLNALAKDDQQRLKLQRTLNQARRKWQPTATSLPESVSPNNEPPREPPQDSLKPEGLEQASQGNALGFD